MFQGADEGVEEGLHVDVDDDLDVFADDVEEEDKGVEHVVVDLGLLKTLELFGEHFRKDVVVKEKAFVRNSGKLKITCTKKYCVR